MLKEVVKRDGSVQEFSASKIKRAILKANNEVAALEQATPEEIDSIVDYISSVSVNSLHIEAIQNLVENSLMDLKHFELARKYITYRYTHYLARELTTTEKSIVSLLRGTNQDVMEENSNKNAALASTQRDLMAGEVSKDITRRVLLPDNIKFAIDNRWIHWHDMDYTAQSIFNCFSRNTYFITKEGTKSFNDYNSGDVVYVPTHTGEWQKATVKSYGIQQLYKYTLRRGRCLKREVFATKNHRWLLKDGTCTTELKEEDRLYLTPQIDTFDLKKLSKEEKYYWALGFALGDGTDQRPKDPYIFIRLCGPRKNSYASIFEDAGLTVSTPDCFEGDKTVLIYNISKAEILEKKLWQNLEFKHKVAFINGLLYADGNFRQKDYPQSFTTTNPIIKDIILELAELAGYYISSIDTRVDKTNFGDERIPLTWIYFSRSSYKKLPWIVDKIEPSSIEEVFCLEVEKDKSFILSGGIVTGNCCLLDIRNVLENGTVINNVLIESPRTFLTACSITAQTIACVASNQYGGQSVNLKWLARFVAVSREKYMLKQAESFDKAHITYTEEQLKAVVEDRVKEEIKQGIQALHYQINVLQTTNGQSPFVTLFMHIEDGFEYEAELALIIEEILKQRYQGVKGLDGHYITPSFPKLIYVTDENNIHENSKYWYLTELAAKCSIKRSYPDYISAKIMREQFDGEVFSPMGCRSVLSPWKRTEEYCDLVGEPKELAGTYKWEGRFNQGVITLNLPQIAIESEGNMDTFWIKFEERLSIAYKALLLRHQLLEDTLSDISPIHWQYGAIARLKTGESINKLLHNGYSTLSLGYIGIYETVYAMLGKSHTTPEGLDFALKIMHRLNNACKQWKDQTGLGFGLYGTPAESLCYKFCAYDKEKYGEIENVTDKGYYTNSYHIDVREHINAFDKLKFEAQFQELSSGGCISYIEVPNLEKNLPAVIKLIQFMYENIRYAEFNSKSDVCYKCGWDGEISLNSNNEWECPQCHNTDMKQMYVSRRTCGYLGANDWNWGKRKEIGQRVLHL